MPLKTKSIYLNSFIGEAPKTLNKNFEDISKYFDLFYNQDTGTLSSINSNSTYLTSTNANINSVVVDYITVKKKLSYANFIDPNDYWTSFNISTIDPNLKEIETISSLNKDEYIDSIVINNKNTNNVTVTITIEEQEILSKDLNANSTYNIINFTDYSIDNTKTSLTMKIKVNGENINNIVEVSLNLKKIVLNN